MLPTVLSNIEHAEPAAPQLGLWRARCAVGPCRRRFAQRHQPYFIRRLIDVLAAIVAVGRTRPILAISHDFEGPGQVRRRLPAMSASGG